MKKENVFTKFINKIKFWYNDKKIKLALKKIDKYSGEAAFSLFIQSIFLDEIIEYNHPEILSGEKEELKSLYKEKIIQSAADKVEKTKHEKVLIKLKNKRKIKKNLSIIITVLGFILAIFNFNIESVTEEKVKNKYIEGKLQLMNLEQLEYLLDNKTSEQTFLEINDDVEDLKIIINKEKKFNILLNTINMIFILFFSSMMFSLIFSDDKLEKFDNKKWLKETILENEKNIREDNEETFIEFLDRKANEKG